MQIVALWVGTVAVEAWLYWFYRDSWVWREIVMPFLFIVPVVTAVLTWRRLRPRSGQDRRHDDRRHGRR